MPVFLRNARAEEKGRGRNDAYKIRRRDAQGYAANKSKGQKTAVRQNRFFIVRREIRPINEQGTPAEHEGFGDRRPGKLRHAYGKKRGKNIRNRPAARRARQQALENKVYEKYVYRADRGLQKYDGYMFIADKQIQKPHDRLNEQDVQRVYFRAVIALIISEKIGDHAVAVAVEDRVVPTGIVLHLVREIQAEHEIGAEQGEEQICRYKFFICQKIICSDHGLSPSISLKSIEILRTGT